MSDESVETDDTAPFYEDDLVTLYCGSALKVDVWLTADVLIVDPPYGTQKLSKQNGNRGGYGRRDLRDGDLHIPGRRIIANDTDTTLRDEILERWGDRPRAVFGSPRLLDPPGVWDDRLVWDKRRLGTNGGPWRYRHESIYVSEGFERTSDAASSIIEAAVDRADQAQHVHAKPLSLMTKIVAAAPLGVIADPCAGGGATLVACKQLGRRAIGVELEEHHCRTIVRRLAQDSLFGEIA